MNECQEEPSQIDNANTYFEWEEEREPAQHVF